MHLVLKIEENTQTILKDYKMKSEADIYHLSFACPCPYHPSVQRPLFSQSLWVNYFRPFLYIFLKVCVFLKNNFCIFFKTWVSDAC